MEYSECKINEFVDLHKTIRDESTHTNTSRLENTINAIVSIIPRDFNKEIELHENSDDIDNDYFSKEKDCQLDKLEELFYKSELGLKRPTKAIQIISRRMVNNQEGEIPKYGRIAIAKIYENQNDLKQAVASYVEAKKFVKAADLLIKIGDRYKEQNNFGQAMQSYYKSVDNFIEGGEVKMARGVHFKLNELYKSVYQCENPASVTFILDNMNDLPEKEQEMMMDKLAN